MRYYLLDRITELTLPTSAKGLKAVSLSEDFFADHFPRYPTMPGTLLLESLAQLSGVLLEKSVEHSHQLELQAVLSTIERAKFRSLVRPGDLLHLESTILQLREEGGRVKATAKVNDSIVVSAEMLFAFFKLEDEDVRREQKRLVAYWLSPDDRGLPL
jgi:3-hydroxyacyl-[acyl-carrier-protein] dehydratase